MNTHSPHLFKGVTAFLLGYLFLAFASAIVKLIGHAVPVTVIIFMQSFICLILTMPIVIKFGIKHLHTSRPFLHLARDLGGLCWFLTFFLSLKTLPLANATLLSNTVPLWMPFLLLIWFRIKIRKDLWWGIAIGFIGIVLILRPHGNGFANLGVIFALASAFIAAFTLLSMRELAQTEPNTRILFYYFLVMTLAMLPFAIINWVPLSLKLWLVLGLLGIFIWVEQYLITLAFKYATAATLSPFTYLNVVFAALLDWLIWKHVPEFLTLIGILLVIIGGIITLIKENKAKLTVINPL